MTKTKEAAVTTKPDLEDQLHEVYTAAQEAILSGRYSDGAAGHLGHMRQAIERFWSMQTQARHPSAGA
jgi:predicted alpha/beta hydrolase